MVKAMELQERRSELLFIHLQTSLSLCMGISDETEFVTIAIYETMSLEIKATIVWIAIPIKFDNVSVHWRQSNMPKSVPAAYSEFLFDNI